MPLHPRYAAGLLLSAVLLFSVEDGIAQGRRTQKKGTPATAPSSPPDGKLRPESVVVIPDAAKPKVDTALLNPVSKERRRRFEVKVVPAAPPGRSRQEIMYTDSIANRSPRR